MEPIGSLDRLVLLLRQKLLERAKASGTKRASSAQSKEREDAPAVSAIEALEGIDDRLFRRAVVHNLLADHFGSALINEAQFQQVVTRVTDTIEEDSAAARLLDQVVADLRKG